MSSTPAARVMIGMRCRPLTLSKQQLSMVLAGARMLPPHWRSRYLQAIADQLLPRGSEPVTDDAVQRAVQFVLQRIAPGDAA